MIFHMRFQILRNWQRQEDRIAELKLTSEIDFIKMSLVSSRANSLCWNVFFEEGRSIDSNSISFQAFDDHVLK